MGLAKKNISQGQYTNLPYTVDDSGVGQRQLNGTASKTTLKLSEYHEMHSWYALD